MSIAGNSGASFHVFQAHVPLVISNIRDREVVVLPVIDATPPEMYKRLEADLKKAMKP